MSLIERYRCDNPRCTKETDDPKKDLWIHFDCHENDGCSIKKGDQVLLQDLQDRDYCSMDCLLESLDHSKIIKEKNPGQESQRGYTHKPITVPKIGTGSRKAYEWIRDAPTLQECLSGFRERYTKWKVSDEDLTKIWKYYHPQESTTGFPVVIKEGDPYSQEELDIILNHDDHGDAWNAYKTVFPGSERKFPAIRILRNKEWGNTEGKRRRVELLEREKDPEKTVTNQEGFFVGTKVIQVKGTQRAFGVGDITQIRPNGDLVVEFFHNRKVLPADHFAAYQMKKQDGDQALAAAVEES